MNTVERSNDGVKLKRCPLCGSESEIRRIDDSSFYEIECTECCCKFCGYGEDDTIKEWNTRKPIERALERLEEESRLAEEDKEYARAHNPLQYERCDSYLTAIDNAIEILKEEVDNGSQ